MKDSKKQIPTDFIDPLKRDDFTSFLRSLTLDMSHEHRYVSITLPVARIDPLAVLEMQEPGGKPFTGNIHKRVLHLQHLEVPTLFGQPE